MILKNKFYEKIRSEELKEILYDKKLREVMAEGGGVYCSTSQEYMDHASCLGGMVV